jgi:hypothetical protein
VIGTVAGTIHVFPGHPFHQLNIRIQPHPPTTDVVTLVDALEPDIVNQAIRESAGFLWIHGACLKRGTKTLMLVAESGTGKTTLSMGLLRYGYRLLTDDIILIDLTTRCFLPLPRCPKVRPTAPTYLRAIGFDLQREAEMFDRYVLLPNQRWYSLPIPVAVDRVYILSRFQQIPKGVKELDTTSGILALLNRSNLLGIDPDLTVAHDLFRDTRFLAMNLDHFPDDLATIAEGR